MTGRKAKKPKPQPEPAATPKPEIGPPGPAGETGPPGPPGLTGPEGPGHGHADLRGHLIGTVRALLEVMEAGRLNTEQKRAIHTVRVIIGDAYGTDCPHENTAYEQDGRLWCQDCRAEVSPPDAGG